MEAIIDLLTIVLNDGNIKLIYKKRLINHFEEIIIKKFDKYVLNNIKLITKSLLFSLLPLHYDEKCDSYYKLIKTI